MKYLISATPCGFINFISPGYGGRVLDRDIVTHSGYLKVAPKGCFVLADRGFKCIGNHGLHFKVPPSKKKDKLFTEAEVNETRRIASVRIHIERVREFNLLSIRNHSSILSFLDYLVIIACALTNLQGKLIKS